LIKFDIRWLRKRVRITGSYDKPEPKGLAAIIDKSWKLLLVAVVGVFLILAIQHGGETDIGIGKNRLKYSPLPSEAPTRPPSEDHPGEGQTVARENKRDREPSKARQQAFQERKPRRKTGFVIAGQDKPKLDMGTFNLEVPEQGDEDSDEPNRKNSSIRNGVRFYIYTLACNKQPVLPEICYLPKDRPRPLIRGW
jgi:hypothetical protein